MNWYGIKSWKLWIFFCSKTFLAICMIHLYEKQSHIANMRISQKYKGHEDSMHKDLAILKSLYQLFSQQPLLPIKSVIKTQKMHQNARCSLNMQSRFFFVLQLPMWPGPNTYFTDKIFILLFQYIFLKISYVIYKRMFLSQN